ncbi:MAG: hypothetical protein OCD02_10425 [Spirochaetaceae bacterium]
MRSSVIAFIFIISISAIITVYSSNVLTLSKGINKLSGKIDRSLTNLDIIEQITEVLNSETDKSYELIVRELNELNNSDRIITIKDISSKLNPNFVDFTLFKQTGLKSKLADNITWLTLQQYRDDNGFISDLTPYNQFLKNHDEDIFTLYNIPNLNNASDISLKNYYYHFTQDEYKATQFKEHIVSKRLKQLLVDDQNINKFFFLFDKDFKDRVTIIPTWNVNFLTDDLLTVIISKKYGGTNIEYFNNKLGTIKTLRKSEYITSAKLKRILELKDNQKSILTYVGDKTTFWEVNITDNVKKSETKIVFGLYLEQYRVVSLKVELL